MRALPFTAVQLVGAVSVVHFAVGSAELARIAAAGVLGEYLAGRFLVRPRPLLFLLSSVAVLAGLVAAGRGRVSPRRASQPGIAVMATYLVGWLAWHTVLDHGFALDPAGAVGGADHEHGGLLVTFVSHYLDPVVAAVTAATTHRPGTGGVLLGVVAVTLELAATALLLALLRVDPKAEGGGGLLVPVVARLR